MISVDFHVLTRVKPQALLYVCEQLELAYSAGTKVCVLTESPQEAQQLDQMLWTFKDTSFVPHQLASVNSEAAIVIGRAQADTHTTLMNISNQLPEDYARFSQIVEFIFADPHAQQCGRERFKLYRQQGYSIQTYKI
jgi:DNA polymerase-3 subunit chi